MGTTINPIIRRHKNKKGVAIFLVLFLMLVLGTLIAQYFYSSRQAQNSAYRYQTSEMARQLAASAQEEAYKFLYDETGNVYGDPDNSSLRVIPGKIIERTSDIDLTRIGIDNRDSIKGIELEIPATEAMADEIMPGRMDITATARIIDFRNTDYNGNLFYDKEGIGTLEIAVTVKAKEKYKNQFPGACTIIRHYDYKVVSILSDKTKRENSYAGNSYLDYALFIRNGKTEFESSPAGGSLNPSNNSLEINAENGGALGKVNFGTGSSNYTYLNISDKTADFLENGSKVIKLPELDANDTEVDSFFPKFRNELKREFDSQGGGDAKFVNVTGHKAFFEYQKLPVTDNSFKNNELLSIRNLSAGDANRMLGKYVYFPAHQDTTLFDGIKIKPVEKLSEILNSDIRKMFFNYGYFKLDISNAIIHYKVKKVTLRGIKWESKTMPIGNEENVKQYRDKPFACFNVKYHLGRDLPSNKTELNLENLYNFVISKGGAEIASKAYTFLNDEFAYLPKDTEPINNEQLFFKPSTSELPNSIIDPEQAHYPYSHFNLFTKRFVKEEELEKFGIYDKTNKKLHLRGIIHCNDSITLGDPSSELEVEGNGVIIADNITIDGAIKKKNPKDVFVIFTRKGSIIVNTNKKIEAVLMAMGQSVKNSNIRCNEQLNLKGALLTDLLLLSNWKAGVTHKIDYDEALNPNKDIYQINMSQRITFERVIENE